VATVGRRCDAVGGVDHPEASDAINTAAKMRGDHPRTLRPISDLGSHQPDRQGDGPTHPHPAPNHQRVKHLASPKSGHIGRWSMWVRARCTIHNSVPIACSRCC